MVASAIFLFTRHYCMQFLDYSQRCELSFVRGTHDTFGLSDAAGKGTSREVGDLQRRSIDGVI